MSNKLPEALPDLEHRRGKPSLESCWQPAMSHANKENKPGLQDGDRKAQHAQPRCILLQVPSRGSQLFPQPAVLSPFTSAVSATSKPTSQSPLSVGNQARRGREGSLSLRGWAAEELCEDGLGRCRDAGHAVSPWQKSVPG